ncbi:META domain-containing protein [Streptomyces sp. NPDC058459]|uniref:META domain-containing protein n=1 Tax=Streptomyces sp. NPDC058459 TaxID=3346508 RepID=UPI003664BE51
MDRHTQRITLTVAAALVPLAVACGNDSADPGSGSVAPAPRLTGTAWRVTGVTEGGTTHRAPAAARIRIDDEGRASGSLGCNAFSAPTTVDGARIDFGALRTTRMACDEPRMTFERALTRALDSGTLTARTHDGALTLTTQKGARVQLTPSASR